MRLFPFALLVVAGLAAAPSRAEAGMIRVTAPGEGAFESGGMSAPETPTNEDRGEHPRLRPEAQQLADSSSSSTTSSTSTGGGASGGSAAADFLAVLPPTPQASGRLRIARFVWSPPPFSTGVFRPPRTVCA